MKKIGRNEPCSCGSGKKYKKCCLAAEQEKTIRQRDEATVATRTLDWLATHYAEGVGTAIHSGYYSGLKKMEKAALEELPSEKRNLLSINIGEWLLTDAGIPFEDGDKPVRDLLLGEDGPDLSPTGGRWLAALGDRPLSLYEVRRVDPGEGLLVGDLLRDDVPDVWMRERELSMSLVLWDTFGARLVGEGADRKLSGALYPFSRERAATCGAKVLRKSKGLDMESESVRGISCSVITTEWLRSLLTASPSAAADDAAFGLSLDPETWAEKPLESLGNRSPRKALKTKAGKRAVVALLKDHENGNAHHVKAHGGDPFSFEPFWAALGLSREV